MNDLEQVGSQESEESVPEVHWAKRIAEFLRKNSAIITIILTVLGGVWAISEWHSGNTTKLIEFVNSSNKEHIERLDSNIEKGFSETRKEFSEVRKEIQGVREEVKNLHGEVNYIRGHISRTEENNSDQIVYLEDLVSD